MQIQARGGIVFNAEDIVICSGSRSQKCLWLQGLDKHVEMHQKCHYRHSTCCSLYRLLLRGYIQKFVVILSSTRRGLCGHGAAFRGHTSFDDCRLEAISVPARGGIDLKIRRSDHQTGRWEALKLKPAQMESDACSANRHQPTAGCLKAFDL